MGKTERACSISSFLPNKSPFSSIGMEMDGPVNPMDCMMMIFVFCGPFEGVDPIHNSHHNFHVYGIFK